jgi:hypothetical protein
MTKDEQMVARLLITSGLLTLLTACESLPDEKALAVNEPAFFRAAPCGPIGASNGTLKRHGMAPTTIQRICTH